MLPTCVFMKPYKIFSYMHKPTINKVVQKFGLFIKFGILTLIFSIQFLSLLSLKVSEQKDTQNKDMHSFFFVRFHVSVHFYQSNIYIYIYPFPYALSKQILRYCLWYHVSNTNLICSNSFK